MMLGAFAALAAIVFLRVTGRDAEPVRSIDAGVDATAAIDVEVETPAGTLIGTRTGDIVSFLGVPYAMPPVGDARFRPPTRMPHSHEPIDARQARAVCPQILLARGIALGEQGPPPRFDGDEDCLHLDVFTRLDGVARPVMVFVHGGGHQRGGGVQAGFAQSELVAHGDVVLVTVHYRLGALGAIALPSLATGNQGLRDVIAALAWVHDDIAALGGDPARVTIFGESSGAELVCALVASPLASGLFARAISESGGGCARWPTLEEGIEDRLSGFARGAQIAAAAGCGEATDVAACMRALDAESIVRAGAHGEHRLHLAVYGPVLDGEVLTASTYDRYARGEIATPLLVGCNADESSSFTALARIDAARYPSRMRAIAGADTDAALAIWPADLEATPTESFRRALSELLFVCPAEDLARVASRAAATYLYEFARTPPGELGDRFGAFHGVELWYLFGRGAAFPEAERPVRDTMHDAWVGFASEGAPRTTPAWPHYAEDAPAIFRIESPAAIEHDVSEGRCARARAAGIRRPL